MTKREEQLWGAAAELVREHGRDATIRAAIEADRAFERLDLDAAHEWRIIVRRTAILLEKQAISLN